jgi:hypothetical protein
MTRPYFSELLPQLAERSKLAVISRLGFANVPLRRHLAEIFSRPYGEPGSFLADPTFEAVFGWKKADPSMEDLVGNLLNSALVDAMDTPAKEVVNDYRFGRDQQPYMHQLQAWEILGRPTPQSIVVASGTGSGKTECFMVPILNHLACLREEKRNRLMGVRALFLYPLNALINSQRDRLRAWTDGFDGDIRFCLYNGNTPDQVPSLAQQTHPNEILDRNTLRTVPPPILVTNATMLEYMLVRTIDKPILDHSQGKLEWIVLDEVHTYLGSQAAEIALLIRRVISSFGVRPEQIRFVATSATIGDPNGKAGQRLKHFLAEVAGIDEDRVHLVTGERSVPKLSEAAPKGLESIDTLWNLGNGRETSPIRYDALANHRTARKLRQLFIGNPEKPPIARLSEVCDAIYGPSKPHSLTAQQTALRWLDLLSGTRDNTGENENDGMPFLPLRAHLFHQTLSGLWACADPSCPDKKHSALHDQLWPYGRLFFEPRKHCGCSSPVYEVITCGDCGTAYLLAGISKELLTHLQAPGTLDEFELEIEPNEVTDERNEDEEQDIAEHHSGQQNRVLIINRNLSAASELYVDRVSRKIIEFDDNVLRLLAREENGSGLICPVCDGRETPRERLFQASRVGAPFLLGGILPTLLEYAPDGEHPADHPYRGRRLLTFNDSRQGTARMAVKLQQDAERNRMRGLVYHLALQSGQNQISANAKKVNHEIRILKQILESAQTEALIQLIAQKEVELCGLTQTTPICFNDLAKELTCQGRDFDRMLEHYRRMSPDTFDNTSGPIELARMFLVREFGRRPKRQNNLETMGLVAVRYPALDKIQEVPAVVTQASNFSLGDWRDFLKLCMDFFVRSGHSLTIDLSWRNWLGMPYPQTWIVPWNNQDNARTQRRWPRAKRSGRQSTLVRLLAYVLKADIESAYGEDRVDTILQAAWDAFRTIELLKRTADGHVLPLDRLAFSPMEHGWICPFTRRFLDTTLLGISPYLPRQTTDEVAQCERVTLPLYDKPFSDVTNDLERIHQARAWLAEKRMISELRKQGLWSDLNDRTIELAPFFTAAEHSAQQDSSILQQYEKRFKAGDLNLLSCSTTMEMGIDIGGISMVAMNNVPPHPANYLQRAGRAGRRREARSVAMTLCKSNPHDQAIYNYTRWAFDTPLPAPHVSLDSTVLVQRHVNAFLLTHFLANQIEASGQDKAKLTCRWFFISGNYQPVEDFAACCRDFDLIRLNEVIEGLKQLVRHSVFESHDPSHLALGTADSIDRVRSAWMREWQSLNEQEKELHTNKETDPAHRAVRLRKERMEGEYLLRELATQGFLPAYGFPANIVAFDNLTINQFKKEQKRKNASREDNRYRRRELASRDRVTALREYAPGSEVVMDGLVYRSAGVTLNWHIPANQQDVREIQNIRVVWRCHNCGASGSGHNLNDSKQCHECGKAVRADNIRDFLEPAGFAADFYENPDNDVTTQHFVPVEAPWISANGEWRHLPNPSLGRFRATVRGHVFHQSRGIHGKGYAVCLSCGRAEPMAQDQHLPPVFQKPHRKLRGARADDMVCPGSHDKWKIKVSLTLGHEAHTDVMELQLKTENGMWLKDRTAALTLAVALRDSIAEILGVRAIEFGCDIKEAKPEVGVKCQSILIYDRYAAGYASSAGRLIKEALVLSRKRLNCSANCDSVCPHCVLDFDQRFAADNLDRKSALKVLTENWVNALELPEELAYFGLASQLEYSRLSEAIWRDSNRSGINQVRLFAGGPSEEWDFGPSPLRHLAYRLASQNRQVMVVIPHSSVESANDTDLTLLASMTDHPCIKVSIVAGMPVDKNGIILAEIVRKNDSIRWATSDVSGSMLDTNWATTASPVVVGNNLPPLSLNEKLLSAAELRHRPSYSGDRRIEIHHQLNGPIAGFGKRFWGILVDQHSETKNLLVDNDADILRIHYQDRYLFTPLSLALLIELIDGLRYQAGHHRWANPQVTITTSEQRTAGQSIPRPMVWSDWPDSGTRNKVLAHALQYMGIDSDLQVARRSIIPHARLMEIEFQSGLRLVVQFDQGVSYWRTVESRDRGRSISLFDFGLDPEAQGERVAEMKLDVEGDLHPTQIFVMVR